MENTSFVQGKSLLLGSDKAILDLANADSATIAVFSDSHGNIKNILDVLKNSENCAALVFCGDGIADLSMIFNSVAVSDQMPKIPPVIAFVRGNNDMSMFVIKNTGGAAFVNVETPMDQFLAVAGHKIFISHGHRYGISAGIQTIVEKTKAESAEVALFGHTHVATVSVRDGVLVLNPGSISLPRGGQPKCFAKLFLEKGRAPRDYVFFELTDGEAKTFKGPYVC